VRITRGSTTAIQLKFVVCLQIYTTGWLKTWSSAVVSYGKTRMVWLADGKKILRICLLTTENHGSCDFHEFRRLLRFLPNAVICRDFADITKQFHMYLLSINCNFCCHFSTKLTLSTNNVASCTTPVPKFTHFSYFLTKQVPWCHSVKSLFCQCWTKCESIHISQCASAPEFHRPKPSTSCYDG